MNKESNGKKIIVTGATGQIGRPLCSALVSSGYDVVVFTRNPDKAHKTVPGAADYVHWDPEDDGWTAAVNGAFGVVNLAGASLFAKRLTKKYAEEVKESRIACNRSLVEAMARVEKKPEVYVNGSSMSYYGYGDRGDEKVSEKSDAGTDWWSRDNSRIENEALKAEALGIRTVNVRTGYVLDSEGSGLPGQVERFRKGQSSVLTPEDAWRPWIHIADEVNLIIFALENNQVSGALNAAAPEAVTSSGFTEKLAGELNVPVKGKMPGGILKMIMGRAATVFFKGNRIVPEKALVNGFVFRYPKLDTALEDLIPRINAS